MHTIIIGGGLTGLTAAALLARGGRQVTVFEKSQLGGRARTQTLQGALFNEGPHALYCAGEALKILRSLGIEPKGAVAGASGNLAWHAGRLHALPVGLVSLLSTSLLTAGEKLEVAPLLAGLGRLDSRSIDGLTLEAWLAREVRHENVRALLRAVVRVSTYAHHPSLLSAGAALRQVQLALTQSVLYLDGGWQTLVAAVRATAEAAGVRIVEHQRVQSVSGASGITLASGDRVAADEIVLAVSPNAAAELTQLPALQALATQLTPVRAACLDLALSKLTEPRRVFALGIDRPLYFSDHSRAARLAAEGVHVVQVAKYLGADDAGSDALGELEALTDAMQPGWRAHVVARRFLPEMVVVNAVPTPQGRPAVDAAGVPGLYLAGDWVGDEAMLTDAGLASAREVCRRILAAQPRAIAA